jgi:NhaP-type Na+/H+ or K+/H+ antiporter
MAAKGNDYQNWIGEWFYIDALYKIIMGVLIVFAAGWFLYKLIFKMTSRSHHSPISRGILSLALTLLPYGITELLGG